jgi:DNA topoisomerase-1
MNPRGYNAFPNFPRRFPQDPGTLSPTFSWSPTIPAACDERRQRKGTDLFFPATGLRQSRSRRPGSRADDNQRRSTDRVDVDLIIVESPNKVADVQNYARLAGLTALVDATSGHLLDLPPMSEGPGVDLQQFLPLKPLQPRDDQAAARLRRLKARIESADRIIVATDADREGEAIAAQLWPLIPRARAWRAAFEEITAAGVKRGLGSMRPALDDGLAKAALCRRIVDRLAGWHATDVVFAKLKGVSGGSAGRLQSAALRLVVDRHKEHSSFVPSTTWGVRARLRTPAGEEFVALLLDERGQPRDFPARDEAESVRPGDAASVRTVLTQRGSQRPRPPFEASSWLQVAQRALGLSVKEATAATQALFESGQTTYPRTDTVRVSEEAVAWARAEIARRLGPSYVPSSPWEHKDRSGSQGAHEAIRPTIPHSTTDSEKRGDLGEHQKSYELIESRFLASQAAARIVDVTRVEIVAGNGSVFQARGQVEIFDGWKRLLSVDAVEEPTEPTASVKSAGLDQEYGRNRLPSISEGTTLQLIATEVFPRITKPRPLFTQAALVAELRRLGIGRPSTYQTIVPLLLSRSWVTEERPLREKATTANKSPGVLTPSPSGVALAEFLGHALPSLVDLEFTATLEARLDQVQAGVVSPQDATREWWTTFEIDLGRARALPAQQMERPDLGPCPPCQSAGRVGRLRLVKGTSKKTGEPYEFAACDLDSPLQQVCGHTAPARDGKLQPQLECPDCKKLMRPVRRKDGGHAWTCPSQHWYLANRSWNLVKSPKCSKCERPMLHREKTLAKGEFFWGCFEDKVFFDSDVFGKVSRKSRPAVRPKGSAQPNR